MRINENQPVLIDFSREKLIHAIIFFLRNTRYCGKLKLFKLLYFLDFLHFKQTAKSVTGLKYYAWEMGPVPKDLFFELNNPGEDLTKCIYIPKKTLNFEFFKMVPRCNFDKRYFSKREIRLMEQLAEIFRDAQADDMTDISHLPNMPWDKTINTKGENAEIDYLLAIDDKVDSLSLAEAKERINEMREVKSLFDK
ncbi:MAG: Panacea domain-containing protein [Desulfobaccales bacterium]